MFAQVPAMQWLIMPAPVPNPTSRRSSANEDLLIASPLIAANV
jgi:hypothetical protein